MTRKRWIQSILALALVLLFGVTGYLRSLSISNPMLEGETMGTAYHITISGTMRRSALAELSRAIDARLAEVVHQMSEWEPDSEISAFNNSPSTAPFAVSKPFVEVIHDSLALSADTGGAFDPTLEPLLNLWGFGAGSTNRAVPSDEAIQQAKAITGWRHLHVVDDTRLRKDIPGLQLGLGAIAKGYGVDAIGEVLRRTGCANWFVEIGGEVDVQGLNPQGEPWRVGVQYPSGNPMQEDLEGVLHLTNGAVATSGFYFNYIEKDGVDYAHILDPATGRATHSDVASVSVTAADCTTADGIATAMIVMGAEKGLAWIERRPGVEAMFLVRDSGGKIIEKFSSGFKSATHYTPNAAK